MINEAARALDEGIVAEPGDVDLAMVFGTGFAPFRGGPLRYADRIGSAELVEVLKGFKEERLAPCELLESLAVEGEGFYSPAGLPDGAGEAEPPLPPMDAD